MLKLYVRLSEGNLARGYAKLTEQRGQTMTEYVLIVSAVAIAVVAAYNTLGTKTSSMLTTVDNQL
ncbi:MAG TPA: Flp family type IVb pilin [Candidatus Binataceae bacterium]|nr:Flp family type IVb pilin [Candidatus Binataceae bacterium]